MRSLSVALAYELRGTGVTCTVVCPGPVSTGFERAANMHCRNFFSMVKPSTPLSVALAYELRGTGVTCTVVCPGPVSTGFERAANMHGRKFFTMDKPSTPQAVARLAYAMMQAGSAIGYSGAFAKLTALGVRGVPTRLAARCAAYMNGGDPHTSR